MTSPRRIIAAAAATIAVGAGALLGAPAATAVPGDTEGNQALVAAWYSDFLGREAASDTDSQYWVQALDDGTSEGDALWAITHTREYNATAIGIYYEIFLQRAADPGARYWVDGTTAQRFPLEWVEQNVLGSPEFAARNGFSDAGTFAKVQSWYAAILGRSGVEDPGEVEYWVERARQIGDLGAVREIWYTPEAVTHRIQVTYAQTLGRQPSAGEVAYWYPREVESDINVAVLIASTPEYRALAD